MEESGKIFRPENPSLMVWNQYIEEEQSGPLPLGRCGIFQYGSCRWATGSHTTFGFYARKFSVFRCVCDYCSPCLQVLKHPCVGWNLIITILSDNTFITSTFTCIYLYLLMNMYTFSCTHHTSTYYKNILQTHNMDIYLETRQAGCIFTHSYTKSGVGFEFVYNNTCFVFVHMYILEHMNISRNAVLNKTAHKL